MRDLTINTLLMRSGYIVDGKTQTWQQAKRLKAKRIPVKNRHLTSILMEVFYCTMMVPTIPPCKEQI